MRLVLHPVSALAILAFAQVPQSFAADSHLADAAEKADHVTLVQHMVTFGRAQRRLAAEHDHPFLVQVVGVVRPDLAARFDLGHGRTH